MAKSGLDLFGELPEPPNLPLDKLKSFRDSDWTGLFFEWHRTVGILAITFSFMLQDSPAVKRIGRQKYLILTSLLNRCGRLMMANLRLASEDRHGEALFILDRSLHETAIKLIWLSESKKKDRFETYLADGIKNDLRFEAVICDRIRARGHKMEIERRMLNSISRSVSTSGVSRDKIARSKRLPSLEAMMNELGFDDLQYVVVQRMGSHHVHGTWTTLLAQNLARDGKRLSIKAEFNPPHPNQLMYGSLIVLDTINSFVRSVIRRSDCRKVCKKLEIYRAALLDHNKLFSYDNRQPAGGSERRPPMK